MNTEVLKLILPIGTFILGSLFTLLIKAIEQRRNALQAAARDTVRLTKDWYTQVYGLLSPAKVMTKGVAATRSDDSVYEYVHNRILLPELILCVEVLKRHRKADRLVQATQQFLDMVTMYEEAKTGENLSCRYCWSRNALLKRNGGTAEAVLHKLDGYVQRIACEAAPLL